MNLTYKYRLLQTKRQHQTLLDICEQQRLLYNAALQERVDCYQKTGKSISLYDQYKSLTAWRKEDDDAKSLPANLQRWTLKRLDEAYKAFFRRLKTKEKAGFPRFRGFNRWRSFGFAEFSGIKLKDGRLYFKSLPNGVKIHFHRQLPKEHEIKACTFRRDLKGWYICFQIEIPTLEKKEIQSSIGIDLGLKEFATLSNGEIIPNPRIAKRHEKELRRRQRALARCKKGSNRRKKIKHNVSQIYAKIRNIRETFLHQQSAKLVKKYDRIVVEDLNVKGMVKNKNLSYSISDAAWSKFLGMIAYKAEKAGGEFIKVNPKNTSQNCSGCGIKVPKPLAMRTHKCDNCGLVIDRDENAALNILAAVVGGRTDNVGGCVMRQAGNIALEGV